MDSEDQYFELVDNKEEGSLSKKFLRKLNEQLKSGVFFEIETYEGYNLMCEELLDFENQIQAAPPTEAAFIHRLYEMMTIYGDPMFWHDLWYGLTQLKNRDFLKALEAFEKVPSRIQSGISKDESDLYEHKSLKNYIEKCHFLGSQ